MRITLFVLLIVLSLPVPGAGRRRPVAVSPLAEEVSLSFVDVTAGRGSEAALDAGALRWRKRNGTTSRRTFGIRIDRSSGETRGTATLRASLEAFDARTTVRINGIALTATPRVIDAHVQIGSVTACVLEIEIPTSAPDGAFSSAIRWEVTTN